MPAKLKMNSTPASASGKQSRSRNTSSRTPAPKTVELVEQRGSRGEAQPEVRDLPASTSGAATVGHHVPGPQVPLSARRRRTVGSCVRSWLLSKRGRDPACPPAPTTAHIPAPPRSVHRSALRPSSAFGPQAFVQIRSRRSRPSAARRTTTGSPWRRRRYRAAMIGRESTSPQAACEASL